MPYCLQPGCPNKVARGRCAVHAAPLTADHRRFKRGATSYTSARWIRVRDVFRVEHPICSNPTGNPRCTITTDVVDHIEPHRGDERLMYDVDNLQPLCYSCHGIKTADELRLGHRG